MFSLFAFLYLLVLAWSVSAAESSVEYCSSVNTGSDSSPETNTYQSIGLCTQKCTSDYAFGILQDKSCWCSNVAPNQSTNSNVTKCNDPCPGYPNDSCGSLSDGLFGYIVLNRLASSTASAESTSTGTATGTSPSETTGTSTTTEADNTVAVHTVSGQAQTVTVSQSGATPAADTASTSTHSSSSGLSSGAVAGVAVGSVAGLGAVLALLLIVICARRRHNRNSRDPSMNNLMLDSSNRHSKASQMSFIKGLFSDGHSPTLSAGSSNTPQRMPTFTDNRMKPDPTIYQNGNRDSSVSLQDNEDYSRPVLRATNPD